MTTVDDVAAVMSTAEMISTSSDLLAARHTVVAPTVKRSPELPNTLRPYDLYLVERSCCEAEAEEASNRLESSYLSHLRACLLEEQRRPVGAKRGRAPPSTPPPQQCGSTRTTTPTSVADVGMMDGGSSFEGATPELNEWARAAARQEAERTSYKRARRSPREVRRDFWSMATVDVEKLGSLTLRDDGVV